MAKAHWLLVERKTKDGLNGGCVLRDPQNRVVAIFPVNLGEYEHYETKVHALRMLHAMTGKLDCEELIE